MVEAGQAPLEVSVLGDLQATCNGRPVGDRLSRKSRALLGYLVVTGRPQTRARLCDLLWGNAEDPRGALRWSLSRIRSAFGVHGDRLLADGEQVAFDVSDRRSRVDWLVVRGLIAGGVERSDTPALEQASALFQGELLEGLDLSDEFRFRAWCVAERDAVRRVRVEILRTLVARLEQSPERGLVHAQTWTAVEPLDGSGHAAVIRLLGATGRVRAALGHYDSCARLLAAEGSAWPDAAIERARMSLPTPNRRPAEAVPPVSPVDPAPRPPEPASLPLVGREPERAALAAGFARAERGAASTVVLLGEPGIGKTRLLDHLAALVATRSGQVLRGRAFETETARGFGPWIDAFRDSDLGAATAASQDRLFAQVVARLQALADRAPTLVVLDDLQWADEVSIALLHFAARALAGARVLFAVAARPGELEDNVAASRWLHGIRRDGGAIELTIGGLDDASLAALIAAVAPSADAQRVFELAEGNPLYALEAARAFARGDADPTGSLGVLVAGHLAGLPRAALALLPWAAALGRHFDVHLLGRVADAPMDQLAALTALEQHGVLRALGDSRYEFAHDVLRQAAYRQLSAPRRRLVHRQLAQAMAGTTGLSGAEVAEIARHADLGGEAELAARAYLASAERCLQQFAPPAAILLADQGLHQIAALPAAVALPIEAQLLRTKVQAGAHRRSPAHALALEQHLVGLIDRARQGRHHHVRSTGHHTLSVLYQQRGEHGLAEQHTLAAETAARLADAATQAHQQGNTARCLLQLGRDVARARALLEGAAVLARSHELDDLEILWAEGLQQRWDGQAELAGAALERAAAMAQQQSDRYREFGCRVALAMLALEQRESGAQPREQSAVLDRRVRDLTTLADRIGAVEQAEAAALAALASLTAGATGGTEAVDAAAERLRTVDSKAPLAYLLAMAASADLREGRAQLALVRAREAATTAGTMRLPNESALAQAVLLRADPAGAVADPVPAPSDRDTMSQFARAALLAARKPAAHTPTHTPPIAGSA